MITFLPYPSFQETAACLDYRRLGKQRVESLMILRILKGETPDSLWKNHPAVRMWKGWEESLLSYLYYMCREWKQKGYRDSCLNAGVELFNGIVVYFQAMPDWLDEKLFSSHRAALLAKNYEHYKQFGWKEEPKIDYYWPVPLIGKGN